MADMQVVLLRKRRTDPDELIDHVTRISKALDLDDYQTRLCLLGDGLALLRPTTASTKATAPSLLNELGYQWAQINQKRSRARPRLVKRFSVGRDSIRFEGRFGDFTIKKNQAVLAIIGSMRGDMLSKLMRKATFSGNKAVAVSFEEKYQSIITATPVLDLYVLPEPGKLSEQDPTPLRIFPGKFDPKSLGDRATQSANRNIDQVVRLIKEFADPFFLEMDFGMFGLPHCRFDLRKDEDGYQANLKAFTQYGWYLCRLYEHSRKREIGQSASNPILPLSKEVDRIIGAAAPAATVLSRTIQQNISSKKDGSDPEEIPSTAEPFLPAPPDLFRTNSMPYQWRNLAIQIGVFILFAFSSAIGSLLSSDFSQFLFTYGIQKGLLFVLLAGYFFYSTFNLLRQKNWLDNTPTSKTRSAAVGMIEVKGTSQRIYNLLSPITQTPCTYFRLKRYVRERDHHNREYWNLKADFDSGAVPFFLEDDTGKVLVNPEGAQVKPTSSQTYRSTINTPWGMTFPIAEDEKCVEEIIPEGSPLYVLGFASPRNNPEPSLKERISNRIRKIKSNKAAMMQYDLDGNGIIDQVEWEAARSDIKEKVTGEILREKSKGKKSAEQIVIERPHSGAMPFVISPHHEQKLSQQFGWKFRLSFLAALVCTGIGVMLFLS